ncbi:MAG: restriction endonuclease subunit S [Selenomonadaceae bacterium]|nr:restriction endonuclease subunit S [Selenomonadaceae bacterium]
MEKQTISNACSLHARIGWQGLTKAEYLDSGDYFLVTGVDFSDGLIDFEHCHYVTKDRYDQDEHIQLKNDDVLVTKDGTIGKVAIVHELDKPATLNSGVFVVRPKNPDELIPEFLVFALRSNHFARFIEQIKVGCTIAHLNQEKFLKYEIPRISIQKQKYIIDIMRCTEKLIKWRKQELQKLDDLIKARFVEMFGDPINNPKGWNMVELGALTVIGSSKRIFERDYVSEGVPFYRTKEIVELSKGNIVSTEFYITEERYAEIKQKYGVPKVGDLLVSAVGTIGVIWIVDGKKDFYYKDGNLIRVDGSQRFNSMYMKILLGNLIAEYKKQMSTGTAYAALTISGLAKMKVYDVPIEAQNQFAGFVHQVNKSKASVQKALDETQLLFDSLMQKYFG